ncbi:MAG: ATP-dependent DNA helicase [Bradymonadaceae bacterium]|nr:ATP-dependent DNA helicase [Lujinxingiaceae bacterium]
MHQILGPGGLLSQRLERYEYRPQQLEMANKVERALVERRPLIVEAATGTGKTLAYLIPALLSQKRVVVSTGTKALQEQLFYKDIPFLREHLPHPFDAVLLKGRKNYLCKLRFSEMTQEPMFRSREDMRLWSTIVEWACHTETGDRAEIDGLPDNYASWNDLSVGSDACLGARCQFYEGCHVTRARERAREATLIVVNHHLFFADLALRDRGHGEVLPEYDAVIFDEAHHLEDVATEYFGMNVSNFRFTELASDIQRTLDVEEISDDGVEDALRALGRQSNDFFSSVARGLSDGRHTRDVILSGDRREQAQFASRDIKAALEDVRGALARLSQLGEVGDRLVGRAKELGVELSFVLEADDGRFAFMGDVRDRGVFLQAAPIDPGELLREKLLDCHDSLVFTSATLASGGTLDFFKQRMGMVTAAGPAFEVDEAILAPVFNYRDQCLVYVPRKLGPPNDPQFSSNMAVIVEYLVDITKGRAFVLFTSYQNLNAVYDELAPKLRDKYPLLKQGDKSRRELLDQFRSNPGSILFATSSFWEGIDVEGEALSLVIIDKLPFANPSDPLTKARLDHLEARGANAFMDLSVPTAALSLKQGFGRLIRSRSDVGIVAILDSRIAHKRYGRYFLQTLPPAPVVWTAPEVKRWWHNLHQSVSSD